MECYIVLLKCIIYHILKLDMLSQLQVFFSVWFWTRKLSFLIVFLHDIASINDKTSEHSCLFDCLVWNVIMKWTGFTMCMLVYSGVKFSTYFLLTHITVTCLLFVSYSNWRQGPLSSLHHCLTEKIDPWVLHVVIFYYYYLIRIFV